MCRQLGLAALHRGGVQGVQPPVLREPLELADTQIDELQPASSHELADRGTDQHLPGTGLGHHPRRQVDPGAGRRITAELHLAGVEPGADLNSQRRHRRHRGDRGAQRWGWSVEPGQEPISRGVHLPATMAATTARIASWWRASSAAQAASPRSRRRSVEPTMSVNSSVCTRRDTATTSPGPVSAKRPHSMRPPLRPDNRESSTRLDGPPARTQTCPRPAAGVAGRNRMHDAERCW